MNFLSSPFSTGVPTHTISVLDSGIHETQFEFQRVLLLMMRLQTQEASFLWSKYLWLSQLRAQSQQIPFPTPIPHTLHLQPLCQATSRLCSFHIPGFRVISGHSSRPGVILNPLSRAFIPSALNPHRHMIGSWIQTQNGYEKDIVSEPRAQSSMGQVSTSHRH